MLIVNRLIGYKIWAKGHEPKPYDKTEVWTEENGWESEESYREYLQNLEDWKKSYDKNKNRQKKI
jgi:hypothetical protein